jgi:hypothetical protein
LERRASRRIAGAPRRRARIEIAHEGGGEAALAIGERARGFGRWRFARVRILGRSGAAKPRRVGISENPRQAVQRGLLIEELHAPQPAAPGPGIDELRDRWRLLGREIA